MWILRLAAVALVAVLVLGMGAYHQQSVPGSVSCGQATGGTTMTVKGVSWARSVGRWMDRWANADPPTDEQVRFYIEGVAKDVLWYWAKSFLQEARGQKLDPLIVQLERDAAAASKAAEDACTPCPPSSQAPDVPTGPTDPPVDSMQAALYRADAGWGAESRRIMAEAVAIRKARGLDPRADEIIGITGAQESRIRNLSYGDRDSIGWLQQRAGWGSVEQRSNTAYQTRKFFDALVKVRDWRSRPQGEVAQAVQISAFPAAYQPHLPRVRELLASLGNVPPAPREGTPEAPEQDGGVDTPIMCAAPDGTSSDGGDIVDTQVVWPTNSRQVGRGYGGHSGIDLNGPGNSTGDPFRAAAAGRVTHTGTGKGYGEAVFVKTDTGYLTIYGHSSRIDVRVGQRVAAGQQLGLIGYSGNVRPRGPEGAHLHFEARKRDGELGTQAGSLAFLRGEWENRNRGTVAAASSGARKVTDSVSGVTYSIPMPAGQRGRAMGYALDQLGEPYRWGGHGPDSWDCSGLVGLAWEKGAGVDMPTHQTESQRAGIPLSSSAKPGDLLYQPGHIQMYLGRIGGQTLILEAPKPGDRVRIRAQWMNVQAILDPTKLGAQA